MLRSSLKWEKLLERWLITLVRWHLHPNQERDFSFTQTKVMKKRTKQKAKVKKVTELKSKRRRKRKRAAEVINTASSAMLYRTRQTL